MAKHVSHHHQLLIDWTSAKLSPPTASPEPADPLTQTALPDLPKPDGPEKARKSPVVLPVPKPLASAIGKGHFGEDERGPVRPTATEVRAITEHHAERLIELLGRLRDTEVQLGRSRVPDRAPLIQEKDRLLSAYQSGIALYAEDFGEHAAHRLDAYVRHHADRE